MKASKIWLIRLLRSCSLIGLLLGIQPLRTAGDCPVFQGYSFIMPNLVDLNEGLAPYLLNFRSLFKYYKPAERRQIEENVQEWRERFCKAATAQDIYDLIYRVSVNEIRQLRLATGNQETSLRSISPQLAQNSFARHLYKYQCMEALDYLLYARKCEHYATIVDPWDGQSSDVQTMQAIIDEGKKVFLQIESHYFRLRYAYQMIRMAHYMRDYQQTLDLYEYLMPKIDNDPSMITWWIEGHRAGALMALGKRVEASYLFSRVFDECPGKRQSAFLSFDIRTDEEWNECLLLCQSDHERAMLYVLRANDENSRLVEEMRHIYNYDPANDNLKLLAVQELYRLEKDLLGTDFNDHAQSNARYFGIPRPIAGKRVVDLQTFVREALQNPETPQKDFWKVLEGYLEVLAGNYYFAGKTFEEARKMVKDDSLKIQLKTWQEVLDIVSVERLNDRIEKKWADFQRDDPIFRQFPDFNDFMRDKLTHLYEQTGQEGKAFLAQYTLFELKLNPKMEVIENLIAICRKEHRSWYEKSMVEKSGGGTIENELINLKANLLMGEGQLEAALKTLNEMKTSEWDEFGLFNPFVDRIQDCVKCPIPDTLSLFNKGELIREFLDLEFSARGEMDPDKSAQLYLTLGIGYYNLTYFGPAWRAMDAFRSGASLLRHRRGDQDQVVPYENARFGNLENFDCSRAQFYFQKARFTAQDPNLAAKAAFWEAKCEQKRNAVFAGPDDTPERDGFRQLITNYANTDFYRRVIRECRTFRNYAAKQ